jgi:mannose-1-phosphate guanylyltransferase
VDSFKEKPDLKNAKKYLTNWAYLWNPAYFVFQASTMLNLFKKHLPRQYKILMNIKKSPAALNKEFLKMKPISIDYGIMEKAEKLLCLPANFDWTDVGHWRTVKDILSKKDGENVIKGKYQGLDSKNNLVYSYSNKLIATIGLKNMIIIETSDAILICPKDKAQDVKKLVAKLKRQGMNKYL